MAIADEKLKKFESSVMKQANAEVQKILSDLKDQKEKSLSDTLDAELSHHFEHMQNELSQIKQSCIKRVSLQAQEANKEILHRREEIRERVFLEVANELSEFTKTPGYEKYLTEALGRGKAYQADDLTVCVSEDDMRFKDTVFKGMTIEKDKKIKIGGFILKSREKGFALDETLDSRLNSQQEYFSTISGLTL